LAKDYRRYSYWLETAGDDLTPRPSLNGRVDADVAILGGGFSGLWTAYYLLRRQPSLRVVIAEAEIAGFGASGRNGAWCTAEFPVGLRELARQFGPERAAALHEVMVATVDEVGVAAAREGIDAQFRRGGQLLIARGAHQLPAVDRAFGEVRAFGSPVDHELLDAAALARRVRVSQAAGALYSRACATIHPGRLVRGLARAVERLGGVIYERSPVVALAEGSARGLITAHGAVRARSVVLAGEAYLARLPGWRRRLLPVYSLITLTEPLSPSQWEAIGWEGNECLASMRLSVDYLSRTADGRILFGGRGAPYRFGSRIDDAYDRDSRMHALLRTMAVRWFPVLKDVRFSHAWGGPLGVPRDWMPSIGYDPASGVGRAFGYTGQGVATTNLAGRILADLITGNASPLTTLPIVNHRGRSWEPEPLRWVGVRYVQRGLLQLDEAAERDDRAPDGGSLAERLGAR